MNASKVPVGWKRTTLGSCCDIVSGGTPSRDRSEFWNGAIPWVTPKDISGIAEPDFFDPPEAISELGLRNSSATVLPKGAVLFSSRAPIGLVAIAGRAMATNQGFKSLVPGPELDGRFLYWAVRRMVPRIASRGTGATFPEVSKAVMSEIEIAFPSDLDEQRRIAAILDKADAIRRKRRQALAETETLLRATFLDMFGDPSACETRYPLIAVEELIDEQVIYEIQDGNHGEAHPKSADFVSAGIPFVTANLLRSGIIDLSIAKRLSDLWLKRLRVGFSKPGDVLLSHKGSIGFSAIVPETYDIIILSPQVTYYRLNTEKMMPSFLCSFFLTNYFQGKLAAAAEQSTRAYAGLQRQKTLSVFFPPFEEQKRFDAIAKIISSRKRCLDNYLKDSERLFHSLMHHIFIGDLNYGINNIDTMQGMSLNEG